MPAFTPGPWRWFGNTDNSSPLYLATPDRGRLTVMDFVRCGMRGAQPRFPVGGLMVNGVDLVTYEVGNPNVVGKDQAKVDPSVYRRDVRSVAHANALLIAAAPELYEALRVAPVLSRYYGKNGFDVERFVADYDAWTNLKHGALGKARGEC